MKVRLSMQDAKLILNYDGLMLNICAWCEISIIFITNEAFQWTWEIYGDVVQSAPTVMAR